ncbi:hypothetical protein [Lactobacillus hominis]|uniref:hypothetical protein n=1 Tax=Lactobacillus hominis TaxID=1203033 RepID=UPI00260BB82D|nr:hypothetical protein [Lactobacillus hominis]
MNEVQMINYKSKNIHLGLGKDSVSPKIMYQTKKQKKMRATLLHKLFELLQNTEPFNQVSDLGFWLKVSNQVLSNTELKMYLHPNKIARFVDRYAPDWKEQTM